MRYLINCAKIHPRLRLMMMAVMGTVHVVMTVHRQHLATAATAFIIGRMHNPPPTGRMARNTRWRWCPMTTTTNAQHHHPPHRRRRRRRDLHAISLTTSSSSSSSDATATQEPIIITPYTINQTICPSTHTTILEPLITKHIHNLPQYWKNKPTAKHNEEAFELALEFVLRFGQQHLQPQLCLSKNQGRDCSSSSSSVRRTKVILDSGCGTGKSTHILGERYPDCVVIGIDQSLARLSRNNSYRHDTNGPNNNVLLLRADVTDFWKFCLASSSWHTHAVIIQHYLLYPNPYPKKSRLMNRFYAHPAFPLLMMTLTMNSMNSDGDDDVVDIDTIDSDDAKLVVRSNWKGYLDEFCVASEVWIKSGADFDDWNSFLSHNDDDDSCCEGWNPSSKPGQWEILGPKQLLNGVMESSSPPMTNFEAKFLQCGEPVYELSIRRKRSFQYTLNN